MRLQFILSETLTGLRRNISMVISVILVALATIFLVGMGTLWFSTFAKIRYTGPALSWSLAVALASSLTLAQYASLIG